MSLEAAERSGHGRGSASPRTAIARIDDALSASISRSAFSRDQALRTFGEVEASVGDPTLVDRVAAVVNAVAASYCGDTVVDRGRYVDTLLDIRALLVGL